jgi:hypothetical protein
MPTAEEYRQERDALIAERDRIANLDNLIEQAETAAESQARADRRRKAEAKQALSAVDDHRAVLLETVQALRVFYAQRQRLDEARVTAAAAVRRARQLDVEVATTHVATEADILQSYEVRKLVADANAVLGRSLI